jgi:predicted PurR-regulated permease PerM
MSIPLLRWLPPDPPHAPEAVAHEPSPAPAPAPATPSLAHLNAAASTLALCAVLALAAYAGPLLVPILIAALLATGLSPIMTTFARVLPRSLAAASVVLLLLAILVSLASVVAVPAQDWIAHAPEDLRKLRVAISGLTASLAQANEAAQGLNAIAGHAAAAPAAPALSLWDLLALAPGVLVAIGSVLLLAFFFLVHGELLMRRIVLLSPTLSRKKRVVGICRAIRHDTARYLLVTCTINASLGAATALILWSLGIPDPLLWGVAAALANLVPYLGASTIALLLTMVGLLHTPGLAGLYPAAAFVLTASLEGHLLTPSELGWQLRLSPLAILIWLMLCGWLWGLPGLFVAVPTLMCLKIICQRVDAWRWLAQLVDA